MPPEVTDQAIAEAITRVDNEARKEPSSSRGSNKTKDPSSLKGMISALGKVGDGMSGTSMMKESLDTFSSADGSDKKGDFVVHDQVEALERIKQLVELAKQKAKNKDQKWEFRSSPHEQFGKTLDDTLFAFVKWARSDEDQSYNVSKAFRRLECYANWMEDAHEALTEPALTADSVKPALNAWAMKCSVDKKGHLCWWVDLDKLDAEAIKYSLSPSDSLRALTWYSHYIMYDKNAQDNGVLFLENVANVGFFQALTLMPRKLKAKLDRLTIGTLPIRIKAFYILESPAWMDLFTKFMAMFMSKKMKQRIILLKDWDKVEEIVGKRAIPRGFGKLQGSLYHIDPVAATYF